MLRKLLCLMVGQDTADARALARTLGVGTVQVLQMIEILARLGYLEEVVAGCGQPCERCPVLEACIFRHQPRVWTLTRKGEIFLATEASAPRGS